MSKIARNPAVPPVTTHHDPRFYDERDLEAELKRTFQICHECRMCVGYCGSFPDLFRRIDRHGRVGGGVIVNLAAFVKPWAPTRTLKSRPPRREASSDYRPSISLIRSGVSSIHPGDDHDCKIKSHQLGKGNCERLQSKKLRTAMHARIVRNAYFLHEKRTGL